MTRAEAVTDIHDALNAGFDGFALNTHTISSSDTWNTDALNYLFAAASGTSFKLFISFDMSWGLNVSSLAAFLAPYASQSAYYKVNGQAFVSTYTGGTISNSQWESGFIQPLISTYGITPFFVPDFDDFSGYPTGVFSSYPILSGLFSWETAWPSPGTTLANVSANVDSAALREAHAAGKAYMMRTLNAKSTPRSIGLTIFIQPYPLSSSNTLGMAKTGIALETSTSPSAWARFCSCSLISWRSSPGMTPVRATTSATSGQSKLPAVILAIMRTDLTTRGGCKLSPRSSRHTRPVVPVFWISTLLATDRSVHFGTVPC